MSIERKNRNVFVPSQTPAFSTHTKEEKKPDIVCPVVHAMAKDEMIHIDEDGRVSFHQLYGALRKMGLTHDLALGSLSAGVVGNQPKDILRNLFTQSFHVDGMRGGMSDHVADSGVLRNGVFDEERFQELVSYSKDGKTMSIADFSESIVGSAKREHTVKGIPVSVIEFSALVSIFGKIDQDGVRRVSIDVMRDLYQNKKIPEGFEYETTDTKKRMGQIAQFAMSLPIGHLGLSKKGLMDAIKGAFQPSPSPVMSMKNAICTAVDSAKALPTSEVEITKLHEQIEE